MLSSFGAFWWGMGRLEMRKRFISGPFSYR